MRIKLKPDKDIRVQKGRIGRVPVLVLKPREHAGRSVGVLWIHGGGYITGMKEMVYMSRAESLVRRFGVTAAVCMMARDKGIQVKAQFPLYPMISNLDTEKDLSLCGSGRPDRLSRSSPMLHLCR